MKLLTKFGALAREVFGVPAWAHGPMPTGEQVTDLDVRYRAEGSFQAEIDDDEDEAPTPFNPATGEPMCGSLFDIKGNAYGFGTHSER